MKPKCQLNYIGSKYRLLGFLHSSISAVVPNLSDKVFCDLFAGTSIVSRYFKPRVAKVIANDSEYYSFVIARNYIQNNPLRQDRLDELNRLIGCDGFIFKNYCRGGGSATYKKGDRTESTERMYFSDENGRKIDAIRQELEHWRQSGQIDEDQYYAYLCSLLEAADAVANTASVYGAFLKQLKRSAQKPIVLEPSVPEPGKGEVFSEDANQLISRIEGDILYLDPPYNRREYGANYHLLNTIAKYDDFVPKGKTGLRDYRRSAYCVKKTALAALFELLEQARFKHIFLSYNDEGLMTVGEIAEVMKKFGKYGLEQIEYSRFKADSKRKQAKNSTYELLHCLTK